METHRLLMWSGLDVNASDSLIKWSLDHFKNLKFASNFRFRTRWNNCISFIFFPPIFESLEWICSFLNKLLTLISQFEWFNVIVSPSLFLPSLLLVNVVDVAVNVHSLSGRNCLSIRKKLSMDGISGFNNPPRILVLFQDWPNDTPSFTLCYEWISVPYPGMAKKKSFFLG